jgi:zinc transport system substrate-binding protein
MDMRGKKHSIQAILLLALALILTACGGNSGANEADEGKLRVVTSFYPLQYLTEAIGGEFVAVNNLIPTGVEPHDWTPKSRDLTRASSADLFLYNGAGLEGWVDEFLEGLDQDSSVRTVEASHGIDLISGNPEAHAHAHEGEEEHADEEAHAQEHGNEAEDIDPHTWVSPKSMLIMAANVRDSLIAADDANRGAYEAGYATVQQSLTELDEAYEELRTLPRRDIVVSHQAFGYLCRDYGLNQVAIMGMSADAEPKAQDLLNIARFVEEQEIRYIFFEELVSAELAQTLADEADVDTLVLNPVEGLTPEQEANGDNYVSLMESNLQNLRKALQ